MTVQRAERDWLGACEGFRVEAGRCRLGVVQEVVFLAGRPAALVVAAGLLRPRTLLVAAEAVDEVWPTSRRIVLLSSTPAEPRFQALRRRLRRRRS
jgi:hypothetical protein